MTAEKLDATALIASEIGAPTHQATDSDSWLTDNVFHPFVNGTGVIQIYDTIANKEAKPLSVEAAKPFTLDWGVQALSGAAGAIIPYVVAAQPSRGSAGGSRGQ